MSLRLIQPFQETPHMPFPAAIVREKFQISACCARRRLFSYAESFDNVVAVLQFGTCLQPNPWSLYHTLIPILKRSWLPSEVLLESVQSQIANPQWRQ